MTKQLRLLSIFGTRPEAIKMAPLIKALEKDDAIESLICLTAQHREMLDQVMQIFNIEADYDLNIMTPGQTLTDLTAKILIRLPEILDQARPDIVLVHGDTTTSFAASLAAFYKQIKVGHVEAGLRSYNKYEPFPEEVNRQLTRVLADLHFAPTVASKNNLLAENVNKDCIFVTGNTVIDVLQTTIEKNYIFDEPILNSIDYTAKKVIVVTAHRRENFGVPIKNICFSLKTIKEIYGNVEIVYVVHKNPNVSQVANEILGHVSGVYLIPPLNLKDMHNLLALSYLVLTDSGGLQEEVPSLGKPVLVLRNVTERLEGVDAGTLKIIGTNRQDIIQNTSELLENETEYKKMTSANNPFGDGKASCRIVEAIKFCFGLKNERIKEYL
ncbi:non-hydrolyzing UDP-N-acetylglucosamine 2-epimerase [Candidatus Epulonipiscium viviparus]|uniref:non-hydrolyzing UDP-N-acetylglucosamine 2-epimerase n=1 Tax=Candidatus Epulonipiscium viviparus TaxID=420336 RepID=UPI0027380511|nr:UDP-N-acetylglucosamine 2-epimerase (non-hydrolyzing) [Candidatus Epulopiscium viviparus]